MPSSTTYVVRKGDTLGQIAKRFYGRMGAFTLIVAANRIRNPDRLRIGQELVIPGDDVPATRPVTRAVSRPFTDVSARRLATVHPLLSERGIRLLGQCAADGLALMVTQGLRSMAAQDALFAQGRTAPGRIVTNARAGQSYHNFGLAFDVLVLDAMGKADWDTANPGWRLAGQVGKSLGLEWGGDWASFQDLPHFQLTGGLSLERCRALSRSGVEAVWAAIQ
jgi:peptidoglycan L-alanyl-D-glutamate endopeptidase CwlK